MKSSSDHHKLNQELPRRGQLHFRDSSSPYAGPPYLVVLYCKQINLPVAISWNIACDCFFCIITTVAIIFSFYNGFMTTKTMCSRMMSWKSECIAQIDVDRLTESEFWMSQELAAYPVEDTSTLRPGRCIFASISWYCCHILLGLLTWSLFDSVLQV